jgi:hypothetical protein
MSTKKRNPNDATFRNINALKARVSALEQQIGTVVDPRRRTLEAELHTIKQRFASIEEGFYEFFSGVEAARKAAEAFRPQKGRKR